MPYQEEWRIESTSREEILSQRGRTLLEFGAAWCPHCVGIQPLLRELLQNRPEVNHVKVEDGKGRPLGRAFSVRLWPNLVLVEEGAVVAQWARPDLDLLRTGLQDWLGSRDA